MTSFVPAVSNECTCQAGRLAAARERLRVKDGCQVGKDLAAIIGTLQETRVYCSAAIRRRKGGYKEWIPYSWVGSQTEHNQGMVSDERRSGWSCSRIAALRSTAGD